MQARTVTETEKVKEFRHRIREEGLIFWERPDVLAILDPQTAQRVEALNYADLTMFDDVADVLRGRESAPFNWNKLRQGWLGQMRHLNDTDGLRTIAGRMDAILAAEAGREQDLLWLGERVAVEPLIPAIIDGLGPVDRRWVVSEVFSKIAWFLSDVDDGRVSSWHKPKMITLQVLAGLAVRRELKGRLSGRRPRRKDLTDPVVDMIPTLGLGRAVDAVTSLLTAVTGSPGAAAACLLFELDRNPEWRAKMEAELGAIPLDEFCTSPTRLAPITGRFVKEVLRIWSTPPVVVREVRTDLEHGDVCLKKGQQYVLSSYMLHHGEQDWGNADVFDPDRWLAEARRSGQCPHGSYVPFGWAPKSCIGANLGMAQMMLLAHFVCTRYALRVPEHGRGSMAVASLVRPRDFRGAIVRRDGTTQGANAA